MRLVDQVVGNVHPGQALLRAGVLVGSAVAVLAAEPVGRVATWVEVLVALMALIAVTQPDSMAGLGLLLVIGELWLSQEPGAAGSPWLLLAVAGVLVAHLGLLVAAQSPASAAPDARQVLVWAARGTLLWAGAALVWAGARAVESTPAPLTVLVSVLALLLAATIGTGLHLSTSARRASEWR